MRVSTLAATILAIAAVAVAPSACKSNDIAETNSTTNVGGSTVGASGGIVKGPDGVELRIPAGALTKDVTFSIAVAATGAYCRSMASNYNYLPRPAVVAAEMTDKDGLVIENAPGRSKKRPRQTFDAGNLRGLGQLDN